eukprot:4445701-Alexandrium_andersonii.AAC.1
MIVCPQVYVSIGRNDALEFSSAPRTPLWAEKRFYNILPAKCDGGQGVVFIIFANVRFFLRNAKQKCKPENAHNTPSAVRPGVHGRGAQPLWLAW